MHRKSMTTMEKRFRRLPRVMGTSAKVTDAIFSISDPTSRNQ